MFMTASINTIIIIVVSTIALLIIYKCLFSKGNSKKRNNIMIIGPSLSGKTSFFYHLLGKKNAKTVVSMQINKVENYPCELISNVNKYTLMDIPGTGYYKDKILDFLNDALILLLFIDSYPYKHKYTTATMDKIKKIIERRSSDISSDEHLENI